MPEGKVAPALHETSAKHIYEAMLTGPAEMPVFSNGNLSPEDKRDVILYLQSIKDDPGYRGFGIGASDRSPRACSPGWSASARWSASPSGSPPTHPLDKTKTTTVDA